MAPRSLKDPMGWRHSSLRWMRAGASGRSRGRSGVRRATPAMRSRARAISSGRGGSSARIATSPEIDGRAGPEPERGAVDVVRRGQILHRDAEGLEEGDLVLGAASRHAAEEHLAHLAHDVVLPDHALVPGDDEIA